MPKNTHEVTIYVVKDDEVPFCSEHGLVVCTYKKEDGSLVNGVVVDENSKKHLSDHKKITVTVHDYME